MRPSHTHTNAHKRTQTNTHTHTHTYAHTAAWLTVSWSGQQSFVSLFGETQSGENRWQPPSTLHCFHANNQVSHLCAWGLSARRRSCWRTMKSLPCFSCSVCRSDPPSDSPELCSCSIQRWHHHMGGAGKRGWRSLNLLSSSMWAQSENVQEGQRSAESSLSRLRQTSTHTV